MKERTASSKSTSDSKEGYEWFLKKPGVGIRGGNRKVNWIFKVPKESSRGWARHERCQRGLSMLEAC